jgi:hypothetical protein
VFGDDAQNFKIGVRRDDKFADTPGPGHYKHENADDMVNNRSPAWQWQNNTGRPEIAANPNNGPGTYDDNR